MRFMRSICAALAIGGLLAPLRGEDSGSDARRIDQRIDALGAQIAALEKRLSATSAMIGSGAFARGPTLRVDGGSESVLERCRRVEAELAEARTLIAGRDRELGEALARQRELTAAGTASSERIAGLQHVSDQLATARQVLAERQTQIDQLSTRLASSELARMRADKAYFTLAATVLRLPQNNPSALNDVQDLVRQEARAMIPAEGK